MSYTLPEAYDSVFWEGKLVDVFRPEQMQAAFDSGRASRDAEVDKLKLKAELLKVALETSEGYLKQEREEVEALEKFRNEVINATGNKALADWIEKHGKPVPMQQEIDALQAEVEALKARVAEFEKLAFALKLECEKQHAERDAALAKLKELEAKPSPTALELMREYSNGKQWALEEAAKVAEDSDHIVDVGGYYAQLGDANATQRNIVEAIRKLGEGL